MNLYLDNQKSMTQDIRDMEQEFGYPTFTWNNASYGCVPSSFKRMEQLKKGGFDIDIPTTMIVRKFDCIDCMLVPLFTTEPALDDPINLDGESFFIKSITDDTSHTFYQIELKRKKNLK
jgi:hypothetical protein